MGKREEKSSITFPFQKQVRAGGRKMRGMGKRKRKGEEE